MQAWFIDLRKWNSSRFEGGVRYLYEPNFDATAKDYESCLQNGMQCGSSLLFNCFYPWLESSITIFCRSINKYFTLRMNPIHDNYTLQDDYHKFEF